ncbi:Up-regulated during septation-domain-containing protein [Leptodontidium sp. 2 PMI_412]|nr:Up-regulated during septation-domain-containing protein [Leptodontidium sp. 2 PMI_412]
MAHIADLLVGPPSSLGLNNYIARELSPHSPKEASPATNETSSTDDSEKYVWRMHQPTEPRKYQLFPAAKEKLSIAAGQKNGDAESSQSTATGQNGTNEKDRSLLTNALRLGLKPKEQTVNRRRKPSMPADLGPSPMTTVQEVAMDSPTIPGRPPLHERSISAPGNSWRQHVFGESMLSCISGPALDENAEMAISPDSGSNGQAQANMQLNSQNFDDEDISQPLPAPTSYSSRNKSRSASPKQQPLSPKSLTPLVIPQSTCSQPQQRLAQQSSTSRMRSRSGSGSYNTPPDVPPKSARMKEGSPHPRASPYTPMSGSSSSLLSASTAATSVSTTPNTPFALPQFPPEGRCSPKPLPNPQFPLEGRSSPRPWNGAAGSPVITSATPQNHMCHTKSSSDAPQHSLSHQRSFPVGPTLKGHRRHESESAASIMDRGRPKKRSPSEGSPVKRSNSKRSPSIPTSASQTQSQPSESNSPRDRSEEQRAFEHLPTGHSATTAHTHLALSEIAALRKQAIGQASRFQVLCTKDVEALSRELRALDERCEYLRKTHRSLRSGRRNLHERICTYLRSPRVARFSHESMLRQEEALSELDTSIDDWVSKLEQAENRRTRVRQKLLEHVAAALLMSPTPSPTSDEAVSLLLGGSENVKPHVTSQAASRDPNTPPRSPTKSASPERLERVVEEVKVSSPEAPLRTSRRCVESIRIYADSDISALMADVEDEIKRMGEEPALDGGDATPTPTTMVAEKKEEEQLPMLLNAVAFEGMALHKQRSAGKLK